MGDLPFDFAVRCILANALVEHYPDLFPEANESDDVDLIADLLLADGSLL